MPAASDPAYWSKVRDQFLLARLESQNLTFSPEADRTKLIRRLSFDLTGLPPTPEAVDRFIHDESPDAYERLVDELLGSPAYGERWGRHWLDAAGYADSDGYSKKDLERKWAWRYRVDPDTARPELVGQVATRGFQRCLHRTHDVVIGDHPIGPIVAHREHGSAIGHQRCSEPRHADE